MTVRCRYLTVFIKTLKNEKLNCLALPCCSPTTGCQEVSGCNHSLNPSVSEYTST